MDFEDTVLKATFLAEGTPRAALDLAVCEAFAGRAEFFFDEAEPGEMPGAGRDWPQDEPEGLDLVLVRTTVKGAYLFTVGPL